MKKVITYGTFDLLHYGHIRLLERARALGDYLIVGVTADDFDKSRGKINVTQSLIERVEAVRSTGLADEIIVEEYEGQKIDDIRRLGVDIFTVGSDWVGHFDYLNEYCNVVYLDRTQGVSSTEIRSLRNELKLGIVGDTHIINKFINECNFVDGVSVSSIFSRSAEYISDKYKDIMYQGGSYSEFLNSIDALYVVSHPAKHYEQVKLALQRGKHVICESPIALRRNESDELFELARNNNCILFDAIKTAHSTAFSRLVLQLKGGCIGKVMSVDATCTSLMDKSIESDSAKLRDIWNSICAWGPTAMLAVFQILGVDYKERQIKSHLAEKCRSFDYFTKVDFTYDDAVASIKVGKGVKSEGELIISGTQGYVYVPAPWWKTDYFEIRYENPADNKRYFYQLDGEGIRNQIADFKRAIDFSKYPSQTDIDVSNAIVTIIEDFESGKDVAYF